MKLFEDAGIIERHDFRDGRARYEQMPDSHHDHLINLRTGEVIEFQSEEIERLQAEVARRLGYRLVDHRLELYAVPLDDKTKATRLLKLSITRSGEVRTMRKIAWHLAARPRARRRPAGDRSRRAGARNIPTGRSR